MLHTIARREFLTATAGVAAFPRIVSAAMLSGGGTSKAEVLPGLDDYCRQAKAEWKVPGMSLAVIRDGKLLLARGYGVRELGKDAPVDEHTIFSIASCTKSFTAAAIGKLVDDRKLRWDDPLSQHVPKLVVPTQERDQVVTIRHALQHRTGLSTANMLWRSGQFDSAEILRRVRFLKPVAAPGEKLIYSNVMYLAAGKAAEHASGRSWNELVTTELFEPLSMKRSLADIARLKDFDNLAAPHATIDGEVQVTARYCPEAIAPAGAIHSTAADLANWLIMHLNRGRHAGRAVLSAASVDEMHTPVELPSEEASSETEVPKAPITRYGLGWFVNDHGGHQMVEHSGTSPGFVTWMSIMPKERLGVVILSNHHRSGINYALRSWIFDRLLDRPDRDWSGEVLQDYTNGWQRILREAKAEFDAKRPPEQPPSLAPGEYAGTYESPLYGTIKVNEANGRLKLRFGNRFHGELKTWHGDAFRAFFPNPRLDDWLVTFAVSDGNVVSLKVKEAPWAPEWYEDQDDLGEFRKR